MKKYIQEHKYVLLVLYLPIYLISNGICESVVAADLRPMPLQAAKNNAQQAGLLDRITFCLSDGLRSVPLEGIDTVICAGMGGDTIQSILQGTLDIWHSGVQFILQVSFIYAILCDMYAALGRLYEIPPVGFSYPAKLKK